MVGLVSVANLHKNYGSLSVLVDVSLDVADGEIVSIIGPNGAGKTTLFKVLTGESRGHRGTVSYGGVDITDMAPERRVRLGFGRTFQISRVLPSSTVLENLVVAIEARHRNKGLRTGGIFRVKPTDRVIEEAHHAAETVGLLARMEVEARFLSHGDRKRLEIAAMLCLEPRVLMLDEPTAGMSPADRVDAMELVRKIKIERGLTVMLTEHDMDVVFGLSDRVLVLNFGRVVACDTPERIRNDPDVRAVYLGREAH